MDIVSFLFNKLIKSRQVSQTKNIKSHTLIFMIYISLYSYTSKNLNHNVSRPQNKSAMEIDLLLKNNFSNTT